jgi:PAS domain S-box-containing protein
MVDDDEAYTRYVEHVFARTLSPHLDLVHVTRLHDVMPALALTSVSVILLDVQLPDGDGLQWLRDNRTRLNAAVIVLTSYAEFSDAPDLATLAQEFLVKSEIEPAQLIRSVRHAAERERARQQLLRSREYFQSLIENTREIFTVVDDRGIVLYQSPSSMTLLGIAPESLIGRPIFDLIVESDAPRAKALLNELFGAGRYTTAADFDVYDANGMVRTLEIEGSRIPTIGDSPRAVLNARDVTERRRTEQLLRGREEELRQAQKMEAVGRLAGGIAHDFSNLLTVVTGACERLRDRFGDNPIAHDDLETVLRNCMRGAAMTRQLLAFSRQQTLSPRRIDLAELVAGTGALLKQLIGEHIRLELDVPSDLHPVEADRIQMEQVLMNLAINARDAMPGGGTLHLVVKNTVVTREFAEKHPPMPVGEFVLIEVSDTGHGMSSETRAHAFEPFFTTKDPSHGTGLGLSTVYGIVKQTGGYVWIESEPGAGTTFRVFLPPTNLPPDEEAPPQAPPQGALAGTVLLAEDENEVRDLLYDLLVSQGFEVIAAGSGAEALELAKTHDGPIHLLLTDIVMPGGTGRDLARQLADRRPETRVLYMSGYPEHGARPGSVLEAGAPFIPKPFTRDQLLGKIRQILA